MTDGLPGTRLVRGAMVAFGIAAVLAVYLLIAPPTLPHEQERTGGAPPAGSSPPGDGRPSGGGSPASPGGAAPAPQPTSGPTTASPSPNASSQPARRHTIQSGDTLLQIAEQYDTTVDAIRAANPGLNETALTVGQEITIPANR